jgi:hypothetical protein
VMRPELKQHAAVEDLGLLFRPQVLGQGPRIDSDSCY